MGLNKEMVEVIWDTTTSLLAIESYLCTSCSNNNLYDYSAEASLAVEPKFVSIPDSNTQITINGAYASGFYATD